MRTFKFVLLAVLLAFLAAIAGVNWFTTRHLPMRSDPTMFSIPAGASLRTAAQVIESAGIDLPAWQLEILGRAMGRSAKIKAGSYEVEEGITALALLDKLTRGDVTQGELLLAEGKTFRQFRTLLNEHPDLDHDTLKLSDAKILSLLGAKEAHPEGLVFPRYLSLQQGQQRHRRPAPGLQGHAAQAGRGLGATRNHAAGENTLRTADTGLHRGKGNRLARRPAPGGRGFRQSACAAECCCRPIRP
jgi:cell division protein YceG involved in septum cleavage